MLKSLQKNISINYLFIRGIQLRQISGKSIEYAAKDTESSHLEKVSANGSDITNSTGDRSVESPIKKFNMYSSTSIKDIRLSFPKITGDSQNNSDHTKLHRRGQVFNSMKSTLDQLIANNQPTRDWMRQNKKNNGSMLPQEHHRMLPSGTGCIFIHAGRNNTIMTFCDWNFNPLMVSSGGVCGLKGHQRGTPEAGMRVAAKIADFALSKGFSSVSVVLKGFGPGRDSAFRTLVSSGLKIRIIRDETPIRHGGTKPRKARRV